jgi:hypothetical protein
MRKIMRVSLHQRAPDTYYGQWPRKKAAVCCLESPAIVHNDLVALAGSGAFDARERDFPANRAPPRGKFAFGAKKKMCGL